MSVHEVLSDKQPIIEELTARLRTVAEGEGDSGAGLGLRIVTVQIKEAVVSSSRLWENLQKPYRAEREQQARLAELDAQDAISEREMASARVRAVREMSDRREIDELRHRDDAASFDRTIIERVRRAEQEQRKIQAVAAGENETTLHGLRLEQERRAEEEAAARARIEVEAELRRLTHEAELVIARSKAQASHDRELLALERDRIRSQIDNDQSEARIQAKLIDSLAEIAAKMPKPAELKAVTVGGPDTTTVSGLLAELTAVLGTVRGLSGVNRP